MWRHRQYSFSHKSISFIFSIRWNQRVYNDNRTWRQRLDHLHANWMPLLVPLTDAYLHWKATCSDQPQPVPANNCPSLPSDSYSFTITIVDIFTLQTSTFIRRDADSLSPAIDLVRAGFLSHVPMSPSVAISLRTLEHFRHLRLRKPSFSVEAYVKVICDTYKVLLLSTLSFASLLTGIRYPINVAGAQYLPMLSILTWPYFGRLSRKLPLLSVAVPSTGAYSTHALPAPMSWRMSPYYHSLGCMSWMAGTQPNAWQG